MACRYMDGKTGHEANDKFHMSAGNNLEEVVNRVDAVHNAEVVDRTDAVNRVEARNMVEAVNRADAVNMVEAANRAEALNMVEAVNDAWVRLDYTHNDGGYLVN